MSHRSLPDGISPGIRRPAAFVFAWLLLLPLACREQPAPVDQTLWKLDSPWISPSRDNPARTAQATLLIFRSNGEFVEDHCELIEQPDGTVYILSKSRHVTALGRWEQRGSEIHVRRQVVARTPLTALPIEPFCQQAQLIFRISGNSVEGTGGLMGLYSPVKRLVAPDFESLVKRARKSPVRCAEK